MLRAAALLLFISCGCLSSELGDEHPLAMAPAAADSGGELAVADDGGVSYSHPSGGVYYAVLHLGNLTVSPSELHVESDATGEEAYLGMVAYRVHDTTLEWSVYNVGPGAGPASLAFDGGQRFVIVLTRAQDAMTVRVSVVPANTPMELRALGPAILSSYHFDGVGLEARSVYSFNMLDAPPATSPFVGQWEMASQHEWEGESVTFVQFSDFSVGGGAAYDIGWHRYGRAEPATGVGVYPLVSPAVVATEQGEGRSGLRIAATGVDAAPIIGFDHMSVPYRPAFDGLHVTALSAIAGFPASAPCSAATSQMTVSGQGLMHTRPFKESRGC